MDFWGKWLQRLQHVYMYVSKKITRRRFRTLSPTRFRTYGDLRDRRERKCTFRRNFNARYTWWGAALRPTGANNKQQTTNTKQHDDVAEDYYYHHYVMFIVHAISLLISLLILLLLLWWCHKCLLSITQPERNPATNSSLQVTGAHRRENGSGPGTWRPRRTKTLWPSTILAA